MSEDADDAKLASARRSLAFLQAQADAVRAELAGLRRDPTRKDELSELRTAQLLEVNAELVEAAVHAAYAAQTAVSSLDELARSTQHDELTGAPTRALMLDRLENAIAMAQRRSTRVGVIFLDLDHFKQINDSLGHAVGDQVLQLATAASRTGARIGLGEPPRRRRVRRPPRRDGESERRRSGRPQDHRLAGRAGEVGPHTLSLSGSLGISIYPEDGADPATLINCADAAMYRAKKAGPGGYAFCSEIVDRAVADVRAPSEISVAAARRPESPLAEHEAHLRELLEANRQLVSAAQAAQKLQAHAEDAHHRQINFVAMAAHALRNPLSAIRMATATARHPKADETLRASQYEVIHRQAMHMARLIDDLLDGSRVGAGEFRLQRSSLELGVILAEAVDALPARDRCQAPAASRRARSRPGDRRSAISSA